MEIFNSVVGRFIFLNFHYSFDRYIYIHGTHEEGLIGTKASHGCIRMFNNDVIYLYDIVKKGTKVYIKA